MALSPAKNAEKITAYLTISNRKAFFGKTILNETGSSIFCCSKVVAISVV